MRHFIIYFLAFFASCNSSGSYSTKPKIDKSLLLGSWTIIESSRYPKNGLMDKITFLQNDSFVVEFYWEGKLQDRFSGRYELNEEKRTLTGLTDTSNAVSEILELTDSILVTKFVGKKEISKFKRM